MGNWGWILSPLVLVVALVLERLPAVRQFRQRRLEQHEARKRRRP